MPRPKKTAPVKRPSLEEILQRWPDIRLPKPLRDALRRPGDYQLAIEGMVMDFSRLGIDVESGFLILRNVENKQSVPLDVYLDPRAVKYAIEKPSVERDEDEAFEVGDEED